MGVIPFEQKGGGGEKKDALSSQNKWGEGAWEKGLGVGR